MQPFDVYLEVGSKRVFAGAVDWPGWCRSGRDEATALEALFWSTVPATRRWCVRPGSDSRRRAESRSFAWWSASRETRPRISVRPA